MKFFKQRSIQISEEKMQVSSPEILQTTSTTKQRLSLPSLSISTFPIDSSNERQLQNYYAKTITKINEHIYLTGEKGAQNSQLLNQYGITHIINCAGYHSENYFLQEERQRTLSNSIKYHTLYLHDHIEQNLQTSFIEIIQLIQQIQVSNAQANILIHCKMGISRAPSMVIAYLIWLRHITYEEAFEEIHKIRPTIGPNIGFITELMEWEKIILQQENNDR